jgi:SAM-dependent methyltransferase
MSNNATDRVREDWERQAPAWFEQRESLFTDSRPVHDWMVDHLEPKPGQRILEIGAGPGDTGFLAARRIDGGRLVSTDLAPGMVETARKRGVELGIQNADYRVLDAQAMDLDDASFDGVLCRWGFMLMPDPAAAFRECRRVLVPGGHLSFAVFTPPNENPWASLPARILTAAGHLPPPSPEHPGIFALSDRRRLQSVLDSAPWSSTWIEPVDMAWTFDDADGYWSFLIDVTALGPVIGGLSEADRGAVRREIDAHLVTFTENGRVTLPARCWCGVAVR